GSDYAHRNPPSTNAVSENRFQGNLPDFHQRVRSTEPQRNIRPCQTATAPPAIDPAWCASPSSLMVGANHAQIALFLAHWRGKVKGVPEGDRSMTTMASGIVKQPDRCGGDSHITVWGLIAFLLVGTGCTSKDPHGRESLTGTVTFHGQPLDAGSIE